MTPPSPESLTAFRLWCERWGDNGQIGVWLLAEVERLTTAIRTHHAQKADDRCIEDDDHLYAAASLPPCDRRVGDKSAMLRNCERFIDRRCEGGGWPTYAELEAENARLQSLLLAAGERIAGQSELLTAKAGKAVETVVPTCTIPRHIVYGYPTRAVADQWQREALARFTALAKRLAG